MAFAGRFVILTRHFFLRLFLNDVVSFEEQMKERVIGILAVLAAFSGTLGYVLTASYDWMPDRGTSWIATCVMVTFSMLVMGFVAILEWDVLVLDARDYINLMPLPLSPGTLLAAKSASLCLFAGMFIIALTALSSPPFLMYIPKWHSTSLTYFLRFAGVHFLTMFLACLFAFLANVVLITGLMTFLGYGLFRRLYVLIRTSLLVANTALFFLFIRVLVHGTDEWMHLFESRGGRFNPEGAYPFFPPLWFVDLYETLLGKTDLPFHGTANYALAGLGILAAAYVPTSWLGYSRVLKKMGTAAVKRRGSNIKPVLEKAFNAIFLRNSIQRAVFHFYRKTLKTSVFHRMRLAGFLAVGLGLIPLLVAVDKVIPKGSLIINRAMLSIPLIIIFFLALGLRGTINVPVAIEANWIFRMTEARIVRPYFSGLRKAVFFQGILPLILMFFALALVLWDPAVAFNHGLYLLTVAVLVTEVLFLRCNKIPFACSYLPGKEKVQLFWFFYLIAFLAFVQILSWIGLELLLAPQYLPEFFAVALAGLAGLRVYQRFFYYGKIGIKYEENPEPVVLGLDYIAPAHIKE